MRYQSFTLTGCKDCTEGHLKLGLRSLLTTLFRERVETPGKKNQEEIIDSGKKSSPAALIHRMQKYRFHL